MSFGLVVYTFGNTPRAAGGRSDTAQAIRDVPDAVHVAEQVGLDSSASRTPRALDAAVLADIPGQRRPAPTQRIKLGTTVTVLPTDEPLQVFQQLAAAAAIAPAASRPSPSGVLSHHLRAVRTGRTPAAGHCQGRRCCSWL